MLKETRKAEWYLLDVWLRLQADGGKEGSVGR